MPAEWEPHARCLMAWPARAELWGERLAPAERDYAAVARAIAAREPVLMAARPEAADRARTLCRGGEGAGGAEADGAVGSGGAGEAAGAGGGGSVEVVEVELDDSWMRDTGPVFVRTPDGAVLGVDFAFNGWGEKYRPYDADARLAARMLEHLGVARVDAGCFVLEGGAIGVDGMGTLVTTESVLLNPNRNPGLGRTAVEDQLARHLGAERVIWLAGGLVEDRDTDGHVDNVCHFVGPGRVIAQAAPDPASPNHAVCAENIRRLRTARDARGRPLEVVEMPHLPYVPDCDPPVVAPYLNFYLAEGAVVVPVIGASTDAAALALIGDALPGREVVPVPGPGGPSGSASSRIGGTPIRPSTRRL
ncbi:MAG: agmatine deiminase family protein [Actinobacteria bacterium]|nr:agmatine deiminase family protein [Actinomycetota bacterium]